MLLIPFFAFLPIDRNITNSSFLSFFPCFFLASLPAYNSALFPFLSGVRVRRLVNMREPYRKGARLVKHCGARILGRNPHGKGARRTGAGAGSGSRPETGGALDKRADRRAVARRLSRAPARCSCSIYGESGESGESARTCIAARLPPCKVRIGTANGTERRNGRRATFPPCSCSCFPLPPCFRLPA